MMMMMTVIDNGDGGDDSNGVEGGDDGDGGDGGEDGDGASVRRI